MWLNFGHYLLTINSIKFMWIISRLLFVSYSTCRQQVMTSDPQTEQHIINTTDVSRYHEYTTVIYIKHMLREIKDH